MPSIIDQIKTRITGIIPARYASSRFPGKPLVPIDGVPMVLKVWEQASESLEEVYIATDHQDIFEMAEKAGAKVLMTSPLHISGTDRVAEAASQIFSDKKSDSHIIINIQGDEPLIKKDAIDKLCMAFLNEEVQIATLIHRISDQDSLNNPNRPKVVCDKTRTAMYFSRAAIPWESKSSESPSEALSFMHVGIYAYLYKVLQELVTLSPTPLEQAEKLEQLRWMEHGYPIHCVESDYTGFGIDVPEDLEKLNSLLKRV